MRAAEAVALGLLHGPAELLPVSSSAHIVLIGAEVDQAMAVALHAGSALALLDRATVSPTLLLPVGALSAAAALVFGDAAERRLGSPPAIAAGLLAGAGALALADRVPPGPSRTAGWRDGVALGLAQATALWPGVSRNGATLAAARARGFTREEANRLSFAVGVPTLIGAAAYKAREARPGRVHGLAAAAAFASTLAARPLLERSGPLWPFAAYRAGLALAVLRRSAR